MPTISRVSNALGDVGHLSLAAAGQNLMLLWLLSKVVWPGVAAFCTFAAVALIVDFVFHLTFFLAVLSVDVRRMELHESLEKANAQEASVRTSRTGRLSWLDALVRNELPPSTRIAGSAILICFTLVLNWHFDHQTLSLGRLVRWARQGGKRRLNVIPAPPPINQARTPAAWLRMQDYETAQEVVRFVRPDSHRFVARVYDPLTVVLEGADRAADATLTPSAIRALWRYVEAHLFPFMLTVVFTIAVVTVLMNYLLWNELPVEEPGVEVETDLKVVHLPNTHSMDVVKLWTCAQGHMVSISLDRVITMWFCHPKTREYSPSVIQPLVELPQLWPIVAATIDDTGTWLALCTATGRVALFALPSRDIKRMITVQLDGQTPCGFDFVVTELDGVDSPALIIVTPDGKLTELPTARPEATRPHSMEHGLSLCVNYIAAARGQPILASISRYTGELLVTSRVAGCWTTRSVNSLQRSSTPDDDFFRIRYVHSVPSLGLLVLVRAHEIDLVDSRTLKLVSTVTLEDDCRPSTLRVLHAPRRSCAMCGAAAIHSLSFAFADEQQRCVMRTFTASSTPSALICLRPASDGEEESCVRLSRAVVSRSTVNRPGAWEATDIQAVLGLRRRPLRYAPRSGGRASASASGAAGAAWLVTGGHSSKQAHGASPRNGSNISQRSKGSKRRASNSAGRSDDAGESDEWECWMLTTDGEFQSAPIHRAKQTAPDHLFVTAAGPVAQLGRRSIAVALGDSVKVIMLGVEKFDSYNGHLGGEDIRASGRRKPRQVVRGSG